MTSKLGFRLKWYDMCVFASFQLGLRYTTDSHYKAADDTKSQCPKSYIQYLSLHSDGISTLENINLLLVAYGCFI